jgi:hypothetical protein
MLFDPQWDWRTAPAYSKASIIGFLKSKPADTEYDYPHALICLHTQYRQAFGFSNWRGYPRGLYRRLEVQIARPTPWTFGAALARAEALEFS